MTSHFETYVNALTRRQPTRLIDIYGRQMLLQAEMARLESIRAADLAFAQRSFSAPSAGQ